MVRFFDLVLAVSLNFWLLFTALVLGNLNRSLGAIVSSWTARLILPLVKQNNLPKTQGTAVGLLVQSPLALRVPWDVLKEKILLEPNADFRSMHMKTAVAVFWIMGKYDMARQAAQDWVKSTAYESLNAHESKRAYAVIHQLDQIQKSYCYEKDHANQAKAQRITKLFAEMRRGNYVKYEHYRDARIALQLLNRSALLGDEPSRQALSQMDFDKNAVRPNIYLKFDSHLAALMGISEREFRGIQREAEKIQR